MRPTLIVGGNPQLAGGGSLAEALRQTGQFAGVHEFATTDELPSVVSQLGSVGSDEVLFLISDRIPQGEQYPLSFVLPQLTKKDIKVLVLATSPAGQQIVQRAPEAWLLTGELTVNKVLQTISGLPGMPSLNPVADSANPPAQPAAAPAPPPAHPPQTAGQQPPPPASDAAPSNQQPPPPADTPPPQTAGQQPPAMDTPTGGGQPAAAEGRGAQPARGPELGTPAAEPASSGQQPPPPADTPPPAQPSGQQQPPPPADTPPPAQQPQQQSGSLSSYLQPNPSPTPAPAPAADPAGGGPVPRAGAYTAQHQPPQRAGRVISVTAPAGGVGKSSVTINLAAFLGRRVEPYGKRVVLIDGNLQQADVGRYLSTFKPNLTGLAAETGAKTPEIIKQHLVRKPEFNLDVLLGPPLSAQADPAWFRPDLFREIVDGMRQHWDYIVIDTPVAEPHHALFDKFIYPETSRPGPDGNPNGFLITVVIPNNAKLLNTHHFLRTLTEPSHQGGKDFPAGNVGVLLNRVQDGIGSSVEDVQRALANWIWLGFIPENREWVRAVNEYTIIAGENYRPLNNVFSDVLYTATGGDEAVQPRQDGAHEAAPQKTSVLGGLLSRFKR